jgi:hypothetical protein
MPSDIVVTAFSYAIEESVFVDDLVGFRLMR